MQPPRISVVIPAYNEERYVGPTLQSVRRATERLEPGVAVEVIVVDNNSADRTAEIARAHGARVVFEGRNQIAAARNAGAREARGEILAFLDADDHVSPGLLVRVHELIASGEVGAGGVKNIVRTEGYRLARLLERINDLGRRLSGVSSGLIFCTRELFESVGGFDERYWAAEEGVFALRLRRAAEADGLRFANITDAHVVKSSRQFARAHPLRLILLAVKLTFFPWKLRDRRACSFWYEVGDRR